MNIRDLLAGPSRIWNLERGASADELEALDADAPIPLPRGLLELLAASNGGEGELALEPFWFRLDTAKEIRAAFSEPFLVEFFPGFIFFGGNGGLERIAIDIRTGIPGQIVMIDPIGGVESAKPIAASFDELVNTIGVAHPDSEEDA